MNELFIAVLAVGGTLGAYAFGKWLYVKTKFPLLLPIFTAGIVIIVGLLFLNVSYDRYMVGGKWIEYLLGPAVVSLAYPLYQHRKVVKSLFIPIVGGTLIGSIIGLGTGVYLAKIVGVDDLLMYSLAPKSVTTPVAMDVAEGLGGNGSIAAVFVMIAGIGGVMLSPYVFRLFRIKGSTGRGVGLGTASHAIGTAKALEISEVDASISTVSMVLSAIFVSLLAPALLLIV